MQLVNDINGDTRSDEMSEVMGTVKAYLMEQKKNEKLLELIVEFESKLTEEVERNEKLKGISDYQDGITIGLQTAKSMFLVQVWQEIERLYNEKN
jgi:hypothetical protein